MSKIGNKDIITSMTDQIKQGWSSMSQSQKLDMITKVLIEQNVSVDKIDKEKLKSCIKEIDKNLDSKTQEFLYRGLETVFDQNQQELEKKQQEEVAKKIKAVSDGVKKVAFHAVTMPIRLTKVAGTAVLYSIGFLPAVVATLFEDPRCVPSGIVEYLQDAFYKSISNYWFRVQDSWDYNYDEPTYEFF